MIWTAYSLRHMEDDLDCLYMSHMEDDLDPISFKIYRKIQHFNRFSFSWNASKKNNFFLILQSIFYEVSQESSQPRV